LEHILILISVIHTLPCRRHNHAERISVPVDKPLIRTELDDGGVAAGNFGLTIWSMRVIYKELLPVHPDLE